MIFDRFSHHFPVYYCPFENVISIHRILHNFHQCIRIDCFFITITTATTSRSNFIKVFNIPGNKETRKKIIMLSHFFHNMHIMQWNTHKAYNFAKLQTTHNIFMHCIPSLTFAQLWDSDLTLWHIPPACLPLHSHAYTISATLK